MTSPTGAIAEQTVLHDPSDREHVIHRVPAETGHSTLPAFSHAAPIAPSADFDPAEKSSAFVQHCAAEVVPPQIVADAIQDDTEARHLPVAGADESTCDNGETPVAAAAAEFEDAGERQHVPSADDAEAPLDAYSHSDGNSASSAHSATADAHHLAENIATAVEAEAAAAASDDFGDPHVPPEAQFPAGDPTRDDEPVEYTGGRGSEIGHAIQLEPQKAASAAPAEPEPAPGSEPMPENAAAVGSVPESLHDADTRENVPAVVSETVACTEAACEDTLYLFEHTSHSMKSALDGAGLVAAQLAFKLIAFAQANVKSTIELACDYASARTLPDVFDKQAAYAKRQFDLMNAHIEELCALTSDVTAAGNPGGQQRPGR